MELDIYKVDILHYINPHLIWVLVQKEDDKNSFSFEQIGIYGILPQTITFEVDSGFLQYEPCEQWMPAASVAMKKCLFDAHQVWFSPIYIDKKSTIFDDSSHKYGELTVVKKNGEEVNLRKEIIKSEFAFEDERLFHQELNGNNLKIHIRPFTMHEVMTKIEEAYKTRNIPKDIWMNTLKNYMSVLKEGKNIESEISSHNLKVYDHDNVDACLKMKMNVLRLCKDVDDVSVGRGYSSRNSSEPSPRKSSETGVKSPIWLNKWEWVQSQSIYKNYTELNAAHPAIPKPAIMHAANKIISEAKANDNGFEEQDNNNSLSSEDKNLLNGENNSAIRKGKFNKIISEAKADGNGFEGQNNNNLLSSKEKNHLDGENNSSDIGKGKNLLKNIKPETPLVAFGPAGLQHSKFNIKPWTEEKKDNVKKEEIKEEMKEPEPEDKKEVTKDQDVYANIDSEVNLNISNLEILKRIKSNSSIQNKTVPNKNNSNATTLSFIKHNIKSFEKKQGTINDGLTEAPNKNGSQYDLDSDNESITELQKELGLNNNKSEKKIESEPQPENTAKKTNVNPFRNVDGTISIFVDKLVTPVLMVHTKKDNRIEPVSNMRDIPFGKDIHTVLRNMLVQQPMRPQTVSWPTILRGHSFFLIGPYNSGNTTGYLPAVCRLVYDFKNTTDKFGLSCIIVCATSSAVATAEYRCKMFLHSAKIFACHVGMTDIHISTSLLNGCDLLICTPSMLIRLIQEDFSLDFRSLSTLVIDDCEHISSVYPKELKFILLKMRDIVKNRLHKEWKIQYIIVSRIWCDFMTSLARKAPDSVVCISAFEECVPYSKAATSVEFAANEKITPVLNFMNGIDKTKKTVIVCRADDEVKLLEKTLTQLKFVVFSCDSTMTVQDLYNLDKIFKDYEEPVSGPVLVCCDGNLTHLNVTDAHYLIHYSLPDLFSTFCKRFSVLNDNYQSIFKSEENNIKIKILFDDTNIEQLPKILQFIKRCTQDIPPGLDEISSRVLTQKYWKKAQNFVPICRNLLTLGKCPEYSNCIERHAIFKEFDSPKCWLPTKGVITFQILHYHSAVYYSARITSCTNKSNTIKYSQTYSLLSFKMGMYYSKMENRKLHGVLKVGDVCAVTLNQNLFVRCQIVKVLEYKRNRPSYLLINLLDEQKLETAQDISLYYLPDDLKNIETYVVTVILANLMPQDKDITFSKLAENQLKRITNGNDELYMRGRIAMVVGNIIFVDILEACQTLSSLEEVVVKSDFRKELLDGHAIPNPDHIDNLTKACDFTYEVQKEEPPIEVAKSSPIKVLPKGRWAHLESDEFSSVSLLNAENPCLFFVQLNKFDDCLNILLDDIETYVTDDTEPVETINVGDLVLAEFPDDTVYERARIDSDIDNNKVKCFFVDQGKWRDVSVKKVYPINERFITQLPFQAIECRLVGIQSPGKNWSDFSTNFFVTSSYDSDNKRKQLFTKYFTKEKAEFTEGYKYGVVLIDTYSSEDVIVNLMMIDKNLAEENDEIDLLNDVRFERKSEESSDSDVDEEPKETHYKSNNLIRSVDLGDSDNSLDGFDLVPDVSGETACSIPISAILNFPENNKLELPNYSGFEKASDENSENRPYQTVSKINKPLPVDDNDQTQTIPSSKSNDLIKSVPLVDSDNSFDRLDDFDFNPHNSGQAVDQVSSIPISQVLSVTELPDTEWDDKVLASPIDNFICPSNIKPLNIRTDSTKKIHKPKIAWRDNKNTVTIKIKLIAEDYDVTIQERYIKFSAHVNDTKYEFDFELYGVVDLKKCSHCNKGQYIHVQLWKLIARNWLALTRDRGLKKWIAYDTDSINVSSDEESDVLDHKQRVERLQSIINENVDSDSDDNLQDVG